MNEPQLQTHQELEAIFSSDQPDMEKLRQGFDLITRSIIDHTQNEVDLARAMQDAEGVVKLQIKMSTIEHARSVFDQCYMRITKRRAWHD
jgi:hypothetical protein